MNGDLSVEDYILENRADVAFKVPSRAKVLESKVEQIKSKLNKEAEKAKKNAANLAKMIEKQTTQLQAKTKAAFTKSSR